MTKHAAPSRRQTRCFQSILFRYPGKGGWTFAPVPPDAAPPVTHGWGRTPVEATVDDITWTTSVWRGADGRTLLAVPKHVRGAKGDGDRVDVTITFEPDDDVPATRRR